MAEKETFYIEFQMNNGDKVEIIETQDLSYDFYSVLKMQKDRWYKNGSIIINLDNVNNIRIETKKERESKEKELEQEALAGAKAMSNMRF